MKINITLFAFIICFGCKTSRNSQLIQDVTGLHQLVPNQVWLSHEHILVNFIGAEKIASGSINKDTVITEVIPYLEELKEFNVNYFVDATPNFLGRDVLLFKKIANETGIKIITNTGLYGARNNKFIPKYAKNSTAKKLAEMWIKEFRDGIDGTKIKPGFIKIGVDNAENFSKMHQKLVQAAALTHLKTGLSIASHTGEAKGLWPQLEILKESGVSPSAFIWVHSQNEKNNENYLKAAKQGCWISLDGFGWELENHIKKLVFAKENDFLDKILISHDAGWYDPNTKIQTITPYTAIFKELFPALKSRGFTDDELNLLISTNPSKAFSIKIRKL